MPMTTRPVSALRSGWRMNQAARATSSSGTASPRTPRAPRTTATTPAPTSPGSPHQTDAATMIASPRQASPKPSRRCTGSRPLALVPTRRAPPPTTPAMPSQRARKARPVVAAAWDAALGPRRGAELRRYVDGERRVRAGVLVPRLVELDEPERVELPRAGVRAAMIRRLPATWPVAREPRPAPVPPVELSERPRTHPRREFGHVASAVRSASQRVGTRCRPSRSEFDWSNHD